MRRAAVVVMLSLAPASKPAPEASIAVPHAPALSYTSIRLANVDVALPRSLEQPAILRDRRSDVAIAVTPLETGADHARLHDDDARDRVFRDDVAGIDLSMRVTSSGFEDFTSYAWRPARERARYAVDLESAGGLRLVDDVLEILDDAGAPRLRMSRPWIRGADGMLRHLRVEVGGCELDTSPLPPWDRAPTPPGASRCIVDLSWEGLGVEYPALLDPAWVSTADMSEARGDATMCNTANGRAIIAGGATEAAGPTTSAEVFDPVTETWATATPMSKPRRDALCQQLLDGRTLFIGGFGLFGELADAETYDPTTAEWSNSFMAGVRVGFSATLLSDGRVLVVGGQDPDLQPLDTNAELFDPSSNQWLPAGPVIVPRRYHAAFALSDGRAMIVSGLGNNVTLTSTELFDPVAVTWTEGPPLGVGRESPRVEQAGGRWYAIGGHDGADYVGAVEAFDPLTNQWQPAASTPFIIQAFLTAPLPSGRVLLFGGELPSVLPHTFVYDSLEDRWLDAGEGIARVEVASVALADGRVLVAGGFGVNAVLQSSSLLFTEGKLGDSCQLDGTCASSRCADGFCCDSSCDGVCEACAATGLCMPVLSAPDPDSCSGADSCSDQGTCLGAPGVSCDSATECASGHCVDGVCCDRPCTDSCEACDGGPVGVCGPIVGDPHGDRPACETGFVCNGVSSQCEALGLCEDEHFAKNPDGSTTDCSPYACRPDGACFARCESVFDCADPFICDSAGACVEPSFTKPDPGCAVGLGRSQPWGLACLTASLVAAARRRRRRPQRSAAA